MGAIAGGCVADGCRRNCAPGKGAVSDGTAKELAVRREKTEARVDHLHKGGGADRRIEEAGRKGGGFRWRKKFNRMVLCPLKPLSEVGRDRSERILK